MWLDLCFKLLFDYQNVWKVTNGVAGDICLKFVVIFGRFWEADHPLITNKHPRNPPIRGHTCGANYGADFGGSSKAEFGRQNIVVYEVFFFVLPNKYYTFVTSPFLFASPSPAPVCLIFGSSKWLDLWLDLCLKLLFDCHKNEGLLHISFTATFYSLQKFPNTSIRLSSLWSGTMVSQNHNGTYRMTKCHDQKR